MRLRPPSVRRSTQPPGDPPVSLLDVEDLSKRFGGVLALDNYSLSVPEKAVVGLIGPNGSGKTMLFNLVIGFVLPDSGSVTF